MTSDIRIETDRLILRAPMLSDFDAIAAFLADKRSETVGAGNMNRTEAWKVFSRIAGMWFLRGYGLFVVEEKATGKPVASIGPWFPITWPEREIGWSVWASEAEGKGIAFEAAQAALEYAFNTLGWDTAVSYIDASNTRSAALAKRLGAVIDADADYPGKGTDNDDGEPCLVYRHTPQSDTDGNVEAYA